MKLGPLEVRFVWRWPTTGWFRFFDWGIHYTMHEPYFSEWERHHEPFLKVGRLRLYWLGKE